MNIVIFTIFSENVCFSNYVFYYANFFENIFFMVKYVLNYLNFVFYFIVASARKEKKNVLKFSIRHKNYMKQSLWI